MTSRYWRLSYAPLVEPYHILLDLFVELPHPHEAQGMLQNRFTADATFIPASRYSTTGSRQSRRVLYNHYEWIASFCKSQSKDIQKVSMCKQFLLLCIQDTINLIIRLIMTLTFIFSLRYRTRPPTWPKGSTWCMGVSNIRENGYN